MKKLSIDFETYNDLDIQKVGSFKYVSHPSCRIVCLGYSIDDAPAKVWVPKKGPVPNDLIQAICDDDYFVYAFNATFDYQVWRKLMVKAGVIPVPYHRWIDVQSMCGRYRLPQNLKDAAIALKCNTQKMSIGKVLMKKCCSPGGKATAFDFEQFYMYCKADVDAMVEIRQALPADRLHPDEQRLWELTFDINERGVPVNRKEVKSIIEYLRVYSEELIQVLPDVTEGFVRTPGQIAKIKKYCTSKGVNLPNLQADTVTEFLESDLPEDVRTVLEIRQLAGMTSVKKFIRFYETWNNGYCQGTFQHNGAGTGRWASKGLQLHNLPRAKVDNPGEFIEQFVKKEPIDKPIAVAKALIRPMIQAPEGKMLIVSDYSSIENIILVWLCDDITAQANYVHRVCQYTDMAAFLYAKDMHSVTSSERQMGKVIILGCGFGMGARRFQGTAKDWGIIVSDEEAQTIINAYRTKYNKVERMWYAYANCAKKAVMYPGKVFKTRKCSFKTVKDRNNERWLMITLPSGRPLYYWQPELKDDRYGAVVTFQGVDPTTYRMRSQKLIPGTITENIVQATARDILANGMLNIKHRMPEVDLCLMVHDEAGGIIDEELVKTPAMADRALDCFNNLLCDLPAWANSLPMRAEGYVAKRYRKD